MRLRISLLALVGLMLVAGALVPARAVAGAPCWRTVIGEWLAGELRANHPASCYRQAVANAPADLRIYSSLEDDLQRVLQSRTLTSGDRGVRRLSAIPGGLPRTKAERPAPVRRLSSGPAARPSTSAASPAPWVAFGIGLAAAAASACGLLLRARRAA